jgi:hypothetical protein
MSTLRLEGISSGHQVSGRMRGASPRGQNCVTSSEASDRGTQRPNGPAGILSLEGELPECRSCLAGHREWRGVGDDSDGVRFQAKSKKRLGGRASVGDPRLFEEPLRRLLCPVCSVDEFRIASSGTRQ